MWQRLLGAAIFYMPFLITIAFAAFVFSIGLLTLLSGTFFVVVLAVYGLYCMLRDNGVFTQIGKSLSGLQMTADKPFLQNIQQSFVLQDTQNIPNRNALYVCSPHGLVGYSWFFHFAFCLSDWPTTSPRPLLAIHSIFFQIPLARELLAMSRCIEASEACILETLANGESVALMLGGVEEMVHAGQDTVKLVVNKRKGYVRLAKQAGIPIVPLYTAGENELFPTESLWFWKKFSSFMYTTTGLQFPLPTWTSMKAFASILDKPLDTPVKTFVLNPIETQKKGDSALRNEYVNQLQAFLKKKSINADILA
jgi:hypothetical protein